jgi:hypothetical protein
MQLRTRFHWIIHDHVIHELYCRQNIHFMLVLPKLKVVLNLFCRLYKHFRRQIR